MTDRELMQQALDGWDSRGGFPILAKAMEAIREKLAQPEQESFSPEAIRATQAAWKMGYDAAKAEQPEQEPVAWPCVIVEADFEQDTITVEMQCSDYKVAAGQHWLYTSPPQRKPLTKEEMFEAIRPLYYSEKDARGAVDISEDEYRAIEAAHGIKGDA
jgi:hypothetical protein